MNMKQQFNYMNTRLSLCEYAVNNCLYAPHDRANVFIFIFSVVILQKEKKFYFSLLLITQ